ncbi:phosphodiester glycosidase family protein [Streptomyces sp. NPDC001941]|uniref:phosphodiester glycosidase family protein n=1 Tax=Streptomyces sp. NPDC001941 TaxID=3154659 RepID=UPI0033271CA4
MTAPHAATSGTEEREAMKTLRSYGYDVRGIQHLARDQRAFAVRAAGRDLLLAPGAHLRTRSVDLGAGCFTNTHTLTLDLHRIHAQVHSAARPFYLPDLISGRGRAVAAVSGTFAFISDDGAYQPDEPRLDLCCHHGAVASLPIADKPALLLRDGLPTISDLAARGTLTLDGHRYAWAGSRTSLNTTHALSRVAGMLTVYSAANCHIRYRDDSRTGLLRYVERATNRTPRTATGVDYVVSPSAAHGLRVSEIHPGGGSDLFRGSFILRSPHPLRNTAPGARVEITGIDGHQVRTLTAGISLGPSVFDAATRPTPAYGDCLGKSPFQHGARHARTLIAQVAGQLVLQVIDGAAHTDTFRGTTPQETAQLCTDAGLDPRHVYHLDGGASSKIAYLHAGTPRVAGSMHYLRWPTSPTQPFVWAGHEGRALHSALLLTPR